MLGNIFLKILEMSITASFAVLVVLVARLILKKAPKVFSYVLWGAVLFRLLCPFGFELPVSLIPDIGTVGGNYVMFDGQLDFSNTAGGVFDQAEALPDENFVGSVHTQPQFMKTLVLFARYIWIIGILLISVYAAVSYVKLRRSVITASPLRDNIYIADGISSPFVMGIFRPKIYLPSSLDESERSYIILHEQYHIRRGDNVVKSIAFAALSLHWFNPFAWIAFIVSGKDMEMSCDEAVVKKMGTEILPDYMSSLLSLATGKRIIAGMPLAFGEGDTKGRIHNLINVKKPAFWIILVSVAVCVVLTLCLLIDPVSDIEADADGQNEFVEAIVSDNATVWFDHSNDGKLGCGCKKDITLNDFPDVVFSREGGISATKNGKTVNLFSGMPVYKVYIADVTGDGLSDLCAQVNHGSGLIDSRIIVYDYAKSNLYEMEDRGYHDYILSLYGDRLTVTEFVYGIVSDDTADPLMTERGYLGFKDNELCIVPPSTLHMH